MPLVPNAKHDIFVSYGHGAPCVSLDGAGSDRVSRWSQRFVSDLTAEILVRLGAKDPSSIDIWMDPLLPGHHPLTETLRLDAQGSAMLLVIMSPYFLASPWCAHELQWFAASASPAGDRKDSIFVVRAFTTDPAAWPEALRDSAGAVPKGYAFHPPSLNPDDVATPYGWPCPDERDKDYHEALGLLARDIARHLKSIAAPGQRRSAADTPAVAGRGPRKSVFVGVIHDTIDEAATLRQRLAEAGMEVLPPPSEEPVDEASLRQAAETYLNRSDALLLIANAHCGRWPKGQDGGFVGYQIQLAKEYHIPCYLWLQLDTISGVKRPEDRDFLERLCKQAAEEGLTLTHPDLSAFAGYVSRALGRTAQPDPGVERLAVVCSNLPKGEHVGRQFQETVLDTLGDARKEIRCFEFGEQAVGQIPLVELQNCVRDADTVLVLCFDQNFNWAGELVKELSRMPDLRAAGKARLIVAGPRDRHAGILDWRTLGFKTINGIEMDTDALAERLKAEILANAKAKGAVHNGAAGRTG